MRELELAETMPSKSTIVKPDKTTWRIIAVELDHWMPRRKSTMPHLYVGLTKSSHEQRLADMEDGAGPKDLVRSYLHLRRDVFEEVES